MSDLMTSDQIAAAVDELDGWTADETTLHRTVTFDGYRDAVAFAVRVAFEAEAANHHPDLWLTYGRVEIALTSHDAGGVTDRDLDLARTIDELVR